MSVRDHRIEIREVAKLVGRHPETIRRWEREGLIPSPARVRGRRSYSLDDVRRIRGIVFEEPEDIERTGA